MSVSEWMAAIGAEQARIAARLVAPAPEVTPAPWERQQDILACYPLRADWEQVKILQNADGNPQRRYQNNWEDYWKQYGELVAGKKPYPAPVASSRMSAETVYPASVLQLAEYAREQSWEVRTQYAQGYSPHGSTGRPTALRDSIALRFGRHPMTDRQAYACYEKPASGSTWVWSGIMIWGPDLPPFAGCGVTELRLFLDAPGAGHLMTAPEVAEWVAEISVRRAAQDAATKLRAKERAKTAMPKPREGMS